MSAQPRQPDTTDRSEILPSPTRPEDAITPFLTIDDTDSPSDVIDALFLGRFTKGEQPYSRSHSVDRVKKGRTLLPSDATVLREARSDGRSTLLAEGEGW